MGAVQPPPRLPGCADPMSQRSESTSPASEAPAAGPAQSLAIVGLSCLFPKAPTIRAFWANLKNGVDAIEDVPPTHWRPEDYYDPDPRRPDHTYCRRGGFLSPVGLDPAEWGISPRAIEATDTAQLLSLVVAARALRDAGYGPEADFDRTRTSVILGVTGTLELAVTLGGRLGHPVWREALRRTGLDEATVEEVVEAIGESYVAWQEDSFPGLLGNVVAGRIANRLNLGGTNCVVDAACASSLSAAHVAAMELATGRADMAVTGGVDAFNDIFMYMCFSKTPALSPTGDARPFDAQADGTILGEGVGMVVLKRLADAERDGDRIYAVIKGIGTSSDGRGKAIYAPAASGQVRALEDAYRQAGVCPSTVGLVEAHGTGTRVGDATEFEALKRVFSRPPGRGLWCALGSVKSQIGHTKAAAGVAGLIKAALALRHKVLPPTIKVQTPNPAIAADPAPFYLNTRKRPWFPRPGHPRRAGVSSFGFGGSNFHAVLEEHGSPKPDPDWDGAVQIVAFSSDSIEELARQLTPWAEEEFPWSTVARRATISRQAFSGAHRFRMLFVLERGRTRLAPLFGRALDRLRSAPAEKHWHLPEGVFFGGPHRLGRLAFVFPGQGAQYLNMCLDLACLFPQMHGALTQADLAYRDMTDLTRQLTDFIFPLPVFNEEARKLQELALRATQRAQPAIGAVSLGLMCVLAAFGVHPQAAAGHSYGELMALLAGGRLDAEALMKLSQLRGRLMAEQEGDRGGMVAVGAAEPESLKLLVEHGLELVVANRNAPDQVVLSGAEPEIERFVEILKAHGIGHARLPVSAAFHSPLVAGAAAPFRQALESVAWGSGSIPIYANATGEPYPEDPQAAKDLLARQLASPVEFVRLIEAMHRDGVRTFLEVGPGARLTGLVRSILGERDHFAVAVDPSSGRGSGVVDLARALAAVAAAGHEVDLRPWDPEVDEGLDPPSAASRLTVAICGANYRDPKTEKRIQPRAEPPPGDRESETSRPPAPQPPIPVVPKPAPPARPATAPPAPPPRSNLHKETPAVSPPESPRHSAHENLDPALPEPSPDADGLLAQALRATHEGLARLQRLQHETAELHRQFLEGQRQLQSGLIRLLERQQRVFAELLGVPLESALPPIDGEPADEPALGEIAPSARSARPLIPPPRDDAAGEGLPVFSMADRPEIAAAVAPPPSTPPSPPNLPIPSPPASPAEPIRPLADLLLDVVSEKTGYPVQSLDLTMDLEGDLGIDSIKRVEILSVLQDRLPDAPWIEPEDLGRLRTLGEIVRHLEATPIAAPPAAPSFHSVGLSAAAREAPPDSAGSPDAGAQIERLLLEILAEKTGYPLDTLEPSIDLEADLGVDSIKRVEILSTLQDRRPDLPAPEPEDLARLRTIGQIAAFVADGNGTRRPNETLGRTTPGVPSETPESSVLPSTASSSGESVSRAPSIPGQSALLRLIPRAVRFERAAHAGRTGLPAGTAWIVADPADPLADALARRLSDQGISSRRFSWEDPPGDPSPVGFAGLILLPPDRSPGGREAWPSASEELPRRAFEWARWAAPSFRRSAERSAAFFVTISGLDGRFGFGEPSSALDPWAGALAGLVKTAAREWPGLMAKAIDVARQTIDAMAAAEWILDELQFPDPIEVGFCADGRWTIELASASEDRLRSPLPPLSAGDLVVVSGGARGVTAEVAVALARRFQPTLLLLGRTPLSESEPDWLQGLPTPSAVKRAIRMHEPEGRSLKPRELEVRSRAVIARREVLRNVARMKEAGAEVLYEVVDVREESQVAEAIGRARRRFGPVRGLIHGAGVIADRRLEEKTPEQFDEVWGTKVQGLRSLLAAVGHDDLRALILFSSVSARLGRPGQADYAMANEALNKLAHRLALVRPQARVLSINWGPWDGGMVTETVKGRFAEEGLRLIPLEAGAEWFARELGEPTDGAIEIVVQAPALSATAVGIASGGSNGAEGSLTVVLERRLSPEACPVLVDHVIKGRPVLPVALLIEGFGHAGLHALPGFRFLGVEDLRIYRPVTLEAGRPCVIRFLAGSAQPRGEGEFIVAVELRGGPRGDTLHAGGRTIVAADESRRPEPPRPRRRSEAPCAEMPEALYRELLFHGPLLQGIRRLEGEAGDGYLAWVEAAPPPDRWLADWPRSEWLADPLLLDAAFQLMSLWTARRWGAPSLPMSVGAYRQYVPTLPAEGARLRQWGEGGGRALIAAGADFLDTQGRLLARLEDCRIVTDAGLREAFRRRRLEVPTAG